MSFGCKLALAAHREAVSSPLGSCRPKYGSHWRLRLPLRPAAEVSRYGSDGVPGKGLLLVNFFLVGAHASVCAHTTAEAIIADSMKLVTVWQQRYDS